MTCLEFFPYSDIKIAKLKIIEFVHQMLYHCSFRMVYEYKSSQSYSHVDHFSHNPGDLSEEHQNIKILKDIYQGQWNFHDLRLLLLLRTYA